MSDGVKRRRQVEGGRAGEGGGWKTGVKPVKEIRCKWRVDCGTKSTEETTEDKKRKGGRKVKGYKCKEVIGVSEIFI